MQTQVSQKSGTSFDFNLDSTSYKCLKGAMEVTGINGYTYSQSVIVRRALRVYARHLKRVLEKDLLDPEEIEIKRAAKGVM
jgi:hypothetical protein